jgi:hypothetical protein
MSYSQAGCLLVWNYSNRLKVSPAKPSVVEIVADLVAIVGQGARGTRKVIAPRLGGLPPLHRPLCSTQTL